MVCRHFLTTVVSLVIVIIGWIFLYATMEYDNFISAFVLFVAYLAILSFATICEYGVYMFYKKLKQEIQDAET